MTSPAPGSALARLKAKRKHAGQAVDRTVDVLVPDSDDVYLRLAYKDPQQIEKIRTRIVGKRTKIRPHDANRINVAVLVDACRGVFVLDGEQKVSIDPDDPGIDPAGWLRIDPRLGELLGADPAAGATGVLMELLGGSDWAVVSVMSEYEDWLTPVSERLDEEHQGE